MPGEYSPITLLVSSWARAFLTLFCKETQSAGQPSTADGRHANERKGIDRILLYPTVTEHLADMATPRSLMPCMRSLVVTPRCSARQLTDERPRQWKGESLTTPT